jgi:hypothetical protein
MSACAMPGSRPDIWALLALPDAASFDGGMISDKLRQIGLLDHGSVADHAAGEVWTCRFGALPFRLTTGIAAQSFLADAAPLVEPAQIGAAIVIDASIGPSCDIVDLAQQLCAVAALIAEISGATRLYWSPARLWSPTTLLADAVAAMEAQSLPPVLHIVAFEQGAGAGGQWSLATRGLGWLVGHEMTLNCPSAYSHSDGLRRATRLAIDAMVHRGLIGPMTVRGLAGRETLAIGPAEAGAPFPRVTVDCRPAPS